jgi:hypothetical protein
MTRSEDAAALTGAAMTGGTRARARAVRLLCGVSGLLAGGLVVLAAALAVAWLIAYQRAVPGPSGLSVAGHVACAAVAVLAQRAGDRRSGGFAVAAALVVAFVTAVVLVSQWLA